MVDSRLVSLAPTDPQRSRLAAKILHWSGKNKPWLPSAFPQYSAYWQPYNDQPACHGRGQCAADADIGSRVHRTGAQQ